MFEPGEDRPVEYANIVLYRAEDSLQVTGTVTDARGGFELAGVGPGEYYLEVSFIGFAARRVGGLAVGPGARLDLGRLALTAAPLPVEGAEAVAERPAVRYELDKRVIEVGALPAAASGTVVDALENAPAVTVDIEGNVKLRGSGNFRVLIDGKPTMLEPSDALRQVPAGAVDRIEIITNPSAMFDPDGTSGIINVIMKQQRQAGWSALSNLHGGLNDTYGGDFLLGYRRGIVNAHAGGDLHRRTYRSSQETDFRSFAGPDTSGFSSAGEHIWQGEFGGARGGVELRPGERDRFGLSGMYRRLDNSSRFEGRQSWFGRPGFPGADTGLPYASASGSGHSGGFYHLSADYRRELDSLGQALAAEGWFGRRDWTTENSSELADTGLVSSLRRDSELASVWSRFKVEYELPRREQDRFEAGYQARTERTDEDGRQVARNRAWNADSAAAQVVSGQRFIHALYGSYAWHWRALGVKAGLRGEYGNREIELAGAGSPWVLRRWDAFPTGHLALGLPGDLQLTAGYSRRIERPHQWFLQPYETWDGATSARVGNPELLPELTDSWEVGCQSPFGTGMVSAEAYWRATADPIQSLVEPHPVRPGVVLSKVVNAGSSRSAGGQVMLNWRPVRFWGISLTGNVYDYRLDGSLNGGEFSRRSLDQSGHFSTDLTLPTQTRLQLTGFFNSPSVTAQGRREGYFVTSAALRQSLLNRSLTLTLRVRDLFGTGNWETDSEGPGFSSRSSFVGESTVFSLALTWNFNNFRLDPKMREPEGMDIPTGPQP